MIDGTRLHLSTDDAVAVLAGIGAVVASFAAVGLTPAFLGSPFERFLSRAMPGAVVTVAIERLGSAGAIEDDGTVQTKEEAGVFPSGATGLVSETVQ